MIPLLLIHSDLIKREEEAKKSIQNFGFSLNHPDLLWFKAGEKLGVEQVKEIREFLIKKPYQGKGFAIVILQAEELTDAAQNALLKTLEEPLGEVSFILGAASEEQLLPTIVSRCQVLSLTQPELETQDLTEKQQAEIEKLMEESMEKRFQFIEKKTDRETLLHNLTLYFRNQLFSLPPRRWTHKHEYLQELVKAQKWAGQNVNIRAILEYLMLKLPNLEAKLQ